MGTSGNVIERYRKILKWRHLPLVAVIALAGVLVRPAAADVVNVNIDGIEDPLLSNVRKSLSVAGEHEAPWSAGQIRRLYRLAPNEIKKALAPYGYYNPVIEQDLVEPEGKGDTWHATFRIKHGPRTRITALNLKVTGPGDELPEIREALRSSKLAEGKRLIHAQYTATKNALYTAAYQAGYLDARFSKSAIRVRPDDNAAQIDLVLNTGERYYFGDVTFDQDVLNDDFVRRFVPFSAGEPFDAERLVDLQLILSDTDYFNKIAIQAERGQATREAPIEDWLFDILYPPDDPLISIGRLQVPVAVTAEPSKPQSYEISGGYGTDTGPRVGFGVKFRHLNKRGHQFRSDLRLSTVKQALQASYDIPIENVAEDKLSFTANVANEEFGDITSINYGIGAVRDTGWSLGRKRAYINLERETYDLGDDVGDRTSTLLYPGYTITLQKADDLLNTRKGVSASLDVHGGSEALASSVDFLQATVSGNAVLPLTSKSRLLLRTQFGATEVDDFDQLPPSQRFFTGGDRTVRGYGYQQISPENEDGDNIGGQYLAVGSIEADYKVYGDYGVAAFFDVGDVANTTSFDLKRGVGIGFRWASPVGQIRLDLAHPLDDPDSDFRIHFSLGPDL
ncbi:outer membrane protein assembly factor [Endozoicomonas sp. G2_2]|uniref:autotransporter assembly complex protein TamA n=1 Tax=Endozoicomonas sp. G2_2 TaxID=2821092 RepID=UPI001ADAC65E|nr:autotransporter assembly complex family protein [Endozoicomonas sp. G2_2]MBO9469905.1 outer membrane protein assembly factor [Endozoicomonas sp. G2_2]